MKPNPMPLLNAVRNFRLRDLSPRRLRLRLRMRWLAWRGVSSLRVVDAQAPRPRPAAATRVHAQEGRRHALRLVELNLMMERARAGQDRHGQPGGLAG